MRICAKCLEPLKQNVKADTVYCRPCMREVDIEEKWNEALNNHLHLIKAFLLRNGMEIKSRQLRELEEMAS
ncbi:hypothetical protein P2R12_06145 [Cytobacillus oceanisediminis]|uniref:hypothetical protein n=1 Tax=Cytobacillus oceanisediminis TaxID=665099 RepID=UPI0023DAD58F|nr:hypothetical protein [Cytobacillus oceanisediminis]MDF2036574.1 hypothetical protein [Cytobacillus oceanisediminis]